MHLVMMLIFGLECLLPNCTVQRLWAAKILFDCALKTAANNLVMSM